MSRIIRVRALVFLLYSSSRVSITPPRALLLDTTDYYWILLIATVTLLVTVNYITVNIVVVY